MTAVESELPLAYREIAPHPRLAPFVECYWFSRGAGPAFVVLPDGCIDFHFDRSARLVGAMTRPLDVDACTDRDVVAVRFRPGGAHPFVRAPLDGFTDADVELAAIDRELGELGRTATSEREPVMRLQHVEAWLLARLPHRREPVDASLAASLHDGGFRVEHAAAAANVSRQFFSRAVRARTGLPPKVLARIVRVRAVLDDATGASAAQLALRHGFADQAHLARDVRDLTGCSLSHWRRSV